MAYSNIGITQPTYALNELLRTYVPAVQKRVYPPGIKRDAQTPRITISPITPSETRVGIGENFGTYKGIYYNCTFRVDIWDIDPNQIETVANQIAYAIWKHRDYTPTTNSSYGQFILLELNGGSGTEKNIGVGLFRCTMNITGRWLSKSQEDW